MIYKKFIKKIREVHTLNSITNVLSWDQETYMPSDGGKFRAEQLALASSIAHQKFVCDEIGELLTRLESSEPLELLSPESKVNIREIRRRYDRKKKLPTELVEELARTCSLSQQEWIKARKSSNFSLFEPWLEKMVSLKKQVAEHYGYEKDRYDSLLDEYEPGATVEELDPLFSELRTHIVPLVKAIIDSGRLPNKEPLSRRYPIEKQTAFGKETAKVFGFDFNKGRIDISAHPFCTSFSPNDVRLTTRYSETDPLSSLYGIMHEAGHGLYEQGLNNDHWGTPMGESISLGIHESQSRTWENCIGRSRAFWSFALPKFKETFKGIADDIDIENIYFACNKVAPSLIRVEADEVTYNLHILLRFEIERDLINDRMQVADLPAIWNERMKQYLDIIPPDDANGVLQDVHWSHGLFGYFPTYTLGNIYGAQLFDAMKREVPDIDDLISCGEFQPIREWLRKNIHQHGMRYQAKELVEKVTGAPPSSAAFLNYIKNKFSEVYGL